MITEINHNRKINWSHVWAFIRPVSCCCIWICYDYLNFSFWSVWYDHSEQELWERFRSWLTRLLFCFVGYLFPNDRFQQCEFTLIICGLSCEGVSSFLSSTFLSGSSNFLFSIFFPHLQFSLFQPCLIPVNLHSLALIFFCLYLLNSKLMK